MDPSLQSIVWPCCDHLGSQGHDFDSISFCQNEQQDDDTRQNQVTKKRCHSKERYLQKQRASVDQSQTVTILEESSTTKNSNTDELEVLVDMHNICSSCCWPAHSRYRRRSFERRGAMNHLLQNVDLISDAQQFSPLLSSCSGRRLSQKRLATTSHNHYIFDPKQLRKEWDHQRSLQHKWSKEKSNLDRRKTFASLVSSASVGPDYLPSSSEFAELQSFDGSKNYSLNNDHNSLLQQLPRGISDVDSPFFPIRQHPKKARSAPQLHSNEGDSTLFRNGSAKDYCCDDSIFSKVPKTLRKELAIPVFKRMNQSGELLSNIVNSSLHRMKTFIKKDAKKDRNLLFEEMRRIEDQNLLNFVRGKDAYYNL